MSDPITPTPTPDSTSPPPAAPETQPEKSYASYAPDHTNLPEGDDDDGYTSDEPETPAEPVKVDPAAAQFKGIKPEVVSMMEKMATDYDLDLSNPKQFKTARALAEKEALILQRKIESDPSPAAQEYLKEFDDPTPETPAGGERATQPAEEFEPGYVKVAKSWKSPEDIVPSLDAAYEIDDPVERNKAVSDVLLGAIDKTVQMNHFPMFMQHVEQMIEARFGPVVVDAREREIQANNRGVVERMKQMPDFSDIESIFEPLSDKPLRVGNEVWEDTLVNRILIDNPSIMSITVKGKTPAETLRKSTAERYKVIYKIAKAMQPAQTPDPKQTRKAFDAGAALEKSKRDQARQGINSPASRAPSGGRSASDSRGELTTADLFKKR